MARSYRGAVVDDNAIISINIKWLLQSAVVIAGLVYSYYSVIQRITELEKGILEANTTITELVEKHILEEQQRFAEMEEELKWYEKELDLNPLSRWGKKKNKRK